LSALSHSFSLASPQAFNSADRFSISRFTSYGSPTGKSTAMPEKIAEVAVSRGLGLFQKKTVPGKRREVHFLLSQRNGIR
jgi:hypothetical protein